MLMYYVPTIPGGWKTFGNQYDSFWCCTGTGAEEYAKLVDTIYFHDESSVYVNQFVASEVSWPEKRARLAAADELSRGRAHVDHGPRGEAGGLYAACARPALGSGHGAYRQRTAGDAIPEATAIWRSSRTWKSGDRVEATLPMALRAEPVAGSPEPGPLAYGPLVLAAGHGPRRA